MQLRLALRQTSVCWSPIETRYISKSSTSTRLLLFTTQFDRSLSIRSLIELHKHTHDAFQITH